MNIYICPLLDAGYTILEQVFIFFFKTQNHLWSVEANCALEISDVANMELGWVSLDRLPQRLNLLTGKELFQFSYCCGCGGFSWLKFVVDSLSYDLRNVLDSNESRICDDSILVNGDYIALSFNVKERVLKIFCVYLINTDQIWTLLLELK